MIHISISLVVALSALTRQTTAQSLGSLSSSCQNAAQSLVSTQLSSCANLVGLISLATTSGDISSPLNSWISGVCSSTPCTSSTLSSADSTVTSGCSTDIANNSELAVSLDNIIKNYPDVRNLLCTQYTSNSTFCLPFLVTSAQAASGQQITFNTLIAALGANGLSTFLSSVPASAVCDDCGQAVVVEGSVLASASGGSASDVESAAVSKCGSTFSSTTLPSSVTIASAAASSSSTKSSSAAAQLSYLDNKLFFGLAISAMLSMCGGAFILR